MGKNRKPQIPREELSGWRLGAVDKEESGTGKCADPTKGNQSRTEKVTW